MKNSTKIKFNTFLGIFLAVVGTFGLCVGFFTDNVSLLILSSLAIIMVHFNLLENEILKQNKEVN